MLNFLSSPKPPEIRGLPLKPYLINFSLDKLVFGVDNLHFDVHFSPQVYSATGRTAALVLIKHSRAEYYYPDYKRDVCENEKEILKSPLPGCFTGWNHPCKNRR